MQRKHNVEHNQLHAQHPCTLVVQLRMRHCRQPDQRVEPPCGGHMAHPASAILINSIPVTCAVRCTILPTVCVSQAACLPTLPTALNRWGLCLWL